MDPAAEQQAFRQREPSKLGRGIERLTHPLGKSLASVIPKKLVERAIKAIDETTARPALTEFDHDTSDLTASRKAAARVERAARAINGSTGAAAGLGGAWTMGADIPATIGIAMRNIRDTGRAYGFEGAGEDEQVFRLKILELAATNEPEARERLIDTLEDAIAEDGALKAAAPGTIEPLVDQAVERVSRAIAFASVRGRLGMLVPIAGSLVGAAVNTAFQKDVAETARFAFTARHAKAHGDLIEG